MLRRCEKLFWQKDYVLSILTRHSVSCLFVTDFCEWGECLCCHGFSSPKSIHPSELSRSTTNWSTVSETDDIQRGIGRRLNLIERVIMSSALFPLLFLMRKWEITHLKRKKRQICHLAYIPAITFKRIYFKWTKLLLITNLKTAPQLLMVLFHLEMSWKTHFTFSNSGFLVGKYMRKIDTAR